MTHFGEYFQAAPIKELFEYPSKVRIVTVFSTHLALV